MNARTRSTFLRLILLFLSVVVSAQTKVWPPVCDSLKQRPYPQWFRDAKLGIFIHWGVYSVPAYGGRESYGEWFLRGLQTGDSLRTSFLRRVYGPDFTYRDLAPLFKAELFDPHEWAVLFREAGAKYIVMVTKHHDGYCLWPSKYAPGWNSMDVGPHRDLVGELARAVREEGLVFGAYYSLPEWNNPLHRWYTDPDDSIGAYVEQHMIPQFKEMVSTYRPKVLFADGEWRNTAAQWHSAELIAWYFNLIGDSAIVNNRWGYGCDIGFLTPEYSSGLKASTRPWAEVRGLGRSFGLNRNEPLEAYMTPAELIRFFVTAVANGGGIILNVGPRADGQIPLLQQERLRQLGEWLKINGEAIYGARMWQRTEETRPVELRRTDPAIDFNWVRNSPGEPIAEDHFTARWEGYIKVPVTGKYLFDAKVDDRFILWIDGRKVVEEGGGRKERIPVRLKAGRRYPVRAEYEEKRQNAFVHLYWTPPKALREIVPDSAWYLASGGDAHGLQAVYRSERQTLVYTRNHGNLYAIALEWPGRSLVLHVPRPPQSTVVEMLGREGPLPWSWSDGLLHIDLSDVGAGELPSCYAWTFRISGMGGQP